MDYNVAFMKVYDIIIEHLRPLLQGKEDQFTDAVGMEKLNHELEIAFDKVKEQFNAPVIVAEGMELTRVRAHLGVDEMIKISYDAQFSEGARWSYEETEGAVVQLGTDGDKDLYLWMTPDMNDMLVIRTCNTIEKTNPRKFKITENDPEQAPLVNAYHRAQMLGYLGDMPPMASMY